jgi:lysophospholipase L1-like esterase
MKKRIIITVCIVLAAVLGASLYFGISSCVKSRKEAEEREKLVRDYIENKKTIYAEENAAGGDFEVIFLGDSLTDGCDIAKYYGEYRASNRGIGGDTTSGLIERLQVSAYDAHPQVIVLLIGGNDILGGKSVDSVCENYRTIITGIRQHLPDTEIVWCSLSALGKDWAKHNETCIRCNERIRQLAEEYGCTFVDIFTPLCDPETGEIFEEFTAEGVHFTDAGYVVVSSAVKEALRGILGH